MRKNVFFYLPVFPTFRSFDHVLAEVFLSACVVYCNIKGLLLFTAEAILKPNSPGYSKGALSQNPVSLGVDSNTETMVYAIGDKSAFIVYDFGQFYDLDRIEIDVVGSKLKSLLLICVKMCISD